MFQEWIDRIKEVKNVEKEKSKGKFPRLNRENFLVMLLLGVLLLVIVWPVEKKTESGQWDSRNATIGSEEQTGRLRSTEESTNIRGDFSGPAADYAAYLERSLEELLSSMEGVGKVQVMITLEGSEEAIVEKDSSWIRNGTTEVDSAGGSRNTTDLQQEDVTVYDGRDVPYVRQVLNPKVAGVAVSAQGGGNAVIVRNITEAIQALFSIDAHKIKIVKMNPV